MTPLRRSSQLSTLKNEGKIEGWIFDLYPNNAGEMVVWVKTEQGPCVKLLDRWKPSFYVSASDREELIKLTRYLPKNGFDLDYEFVERFVKLQDSTGSRVLRVKVPDLASLRFIAGFIWKLGDYGKYRVWNVDLPFSQMYLYEKDLFPLAYVEARDGDGTVSWNLKDCAESFEYQVPLLNTANLKLKIDNERAVPSLEDPINEIFLEFEDEFVAMDGLDEREKILKLAETVQDKDPDILVTDGGDAFLFTYLARRALQNDVLSELVLGREDTELGVSQKRGNTYFSYGRVFYRSVPQRLLGRLHIDARNSGLYARYGLDGLIEVARMCRIPLHRASRVSIGTSMTAIQLYQAVKDGFLVPWKKSEPENFKTAMDLLVADRGGFYFEPKIGIHDNVGEVDFSSMYPMLMLKKNISPETIGCKCCPNSGIRVPELGYTICERKKGIVPKVLERMLKKRIYYKTKKNSSDNPREKMKYEHRQAVYKIILCTSFGYLGYRNARFGKIDAHIATCAFARQTLLDTMKLVERKGFEIIHGIVDSFYLKKANATDRDFNTLCTEINEKIGLPISFEGLYRWIVFLPSKTHHGVPVLNRFYGVFENGEIKARGIEVRRRDTPNIVSCFQNEVLQELAKARNSEAFYQHIPNTLGLRRAYIDRIINRKVNLDDLIISKRISKNPEDYVTNTHQAIAAKQLLEKGIDVNAGHNVRYIILDSDNKYPERRVKAVPLIEVATRYDAKKYIKFLDEALNNMLSPLTPRTRKRNLGAYTNISNDRFIRASART